MNRHLALYLALSLGACPSPPNDEPGGSTSSTDPTATTGPTDPTTPTTSASSGSASSDSTTSDSTTSDLTTSAATTSAATTIDDWTTGADDDCVAPVLNERSLPELGDVRGVHLVDLDGNGDDELLALVQIQTLRAVLDDDSVVTTDLPCAILDPGAIFPLHLDADETMDIIATRDGECMIAGLGTGDGAFTWVDVVKVEWPDRGTLPRLGRGVAIDPEGDGVDALAVVDGFEVGIYSNFLPDLTMIEWAPITAVAGYAQLAVGQLDGAPAPDLLIARAGCEAAIHPGPDFAAGPVLEGDALPNEDCAWLLGGFGGAAQQPVTINGSSGVIEYWSGDPLSSASFDRNGRLDRGTLLESALPGDPRLLVANDDDETLTMLLLWRWASFPALCTASLPIPYGVFTAGDVDGDGIDELAVVGEWPGPSGLRLFSLNGP